MPHTEPSLLDLTLMNVERYAIDLDRALEQSENGDKIKLVLSYWEAIQLSYDLKALIKEVVGVPITDRTPEQQKLAMEWINSFLPGGKTPGVQPDQPWPR